MSTTTTLPTVPVVPWAEYSDVDVDGLTFVAFRSFPLSEEEGCGAVDVQQVWHLTADGAWVPDPDGARLVLDDLPSVTSVEQAHQLATALSLAVELFEEVHASDALAADEALAARWQALSGTATVDDLHDLATALGTPVAALLRLREATR